MFLILSLALIITLTLMVLVTQTLSFGHSGASVTINDQVNKSGSTATESSFTVAGSTTDQQQAIDFVKANLQLIYIKSDQDLTLETNSSSAPADTITITAGIPYVWVAGSGITNPFAGNVTTTYWTNAGASLATVYVRVLVT